MSELATSETYLNTNYGEGKQETRRNNEFKWFETARFMD